MKKIYQLPLLLVALLVTSLSATAHDFEVDGIYYNITDSAALTVEVTYRGDVNSYSYDEYTGNVVIPETVTYSSTTYSVTSIGSWTFSSCSSLTSVTIPNSVVSIGEYIFFHSSELNSIIVDSNNYVYDSRDNCNAIIETATNTLIVGCKSTIIPNSVTSIGNSAFERCTSLTSIIIPNSVTSIGDYAFRFCTNLASVFIPKSVNSIGNNAFCICRNLVSIEVESGNTIYDSRDSCNAIIETASNTLITGCQNTNIPNSVTSIGNYAFYECSGLISITIPNSVTSISDLAFNGCTSLSSIEVESGNTIYDSRNNCNAIIETASNTLIAGCQNTIIPSTVTSIGNNALFACRSSLTSVTIPNSVTTIGDLAFSGCTGLTEVTIPNSVTSIGNGAFNNTPWYDNQPDGMVYINNVLYKFKGSMSKGTSTEILVGTISISPRAFVDCGELTSVIIPNSVISIGFGAFSDCTGLTSITSLNPEPPTCKNYVFMNVPTDCTLYVPFGAKGAYEAADVWKDFTNIVELSEDAGVDDIVSSQATEVARYDIHGRLLTEPTHGVNIVVYSDGTTRKEIVR